MIFGHNMKVFLWSDFVDLSKSFDGLSALVQEVLKEDPFLGQRFVFKHRRSNRIKLLMWGGTGFVLAYKRLDNGTCYWPRPSSDKIHVTQAELGLIFDGMDWRRVALKKFNKPTIGAPIK